MTDPTDAEIDAMLERVETFVCAALLNHPQQARALEMLAQGGHLFSRPVGDSRFEFLVGWFDDPRMRPPDADPQEIVPIVRVPRRALVAPPSAELS